MHVYLARWKNICEERFSVSESTPGPRNITKHEWKYMLGFLKGASVFCLKGDSFYQGEQVNEHRALGHVTLYLREGFRGKNWATFRE